MNELKPCPFCGSSNVVDGFNTYKGLMIDLDGSTRNTDVYFVNCLDCCAYISAVSRTEAIARWNSRASKCIEEQGAYIMNDLTKDEAHAVAELIDLSFIDEIRNNDDVDNMYWIRNVIHAYEKLCAYSGYVGLTEPGPGDAE